MKAITVELWLHRRLYLCRYWPYALMPAEISLCIVWGEQCLPVSGAHVYLAPYIQLDNEGRVNDRGEGGGGLPLLKLPLHEPSLVECDAEIEPERVLTNKSVGRTLHPLCRDIHHRAVVPSICYRQA